MSDGRPTWPTPRDVVSVFAGAVGQLVDLGIAGWRAILELGAAESEMSPETESELPVSRLPDRSRELRVPDLQGETFGETLPGDAVTFRPGRVVAPGTGVKWVTCSIDESGRQIRGDIYRGEVVDDHGVHIGSLTFDAGS